MVDHTGAVLHEVRALAGQIPQVTLWQWGHEARFEQAVAQEIGDPFGILHIGLPPWHGLDVLGIDDQDGEAGLSYQILVYSSGMARKINLAPHLTSEELQQRYTSTPRATDARRYHALWRISQGQNAQGAAQVVGLSEKWVRSLVQRYNQLGPTGLRDQRTDHAGKAPLLSPAQFSALEQALQAAPREGGLWTGAKVAAWIERETGISPIRSVAGCICGGWASRPNPHAPVMRKQRQQLSKMLEKKLQARVLRVRQRVPTATVEVWSQDEARLGVKPILRNVWARKGQRPLVTVHPRYEWLYVYGFVRPATGQTDWLSLPLVTTDAMNLALAACARDVGAGDNKQIVLVLDNAGWHVSQRLVVPPGIELVYLPAATPELQPAERLWPLLREAVANQTFATLDRLQDALVERCMSLATQPAMIQAYTHYHWFPAS